MFFHLDKKDDQNVGVVGVIVTVVIVPLLIYQQDSWVSYDQL